MTKHTPTPLQPQLPFDEIPYGYCHCGCGQKTNIAKQNHTKSGKVKGEPTRFRAGHRLTPYHVYIKRFWERIDRRTPDKCWTWTHTRDPLGYGRFLYHRKFTFAHRFSWELHNGPVPEGLEICHKCDNPSCVNPNHLFAGTHADNVRDMDAKGRRINAPGKGEANNLAKLTEDQVREIRQRFAEGESRFALAQAFGVDHTNIWCIVKRKTWKHI